MLRYRSFAVISLLAFSLSACTSRDTTAADAAAQAQLELQQGRVADASRSIHKAISIHDDVSEYWMILGKIDADMEDYSGAFTAYENALGLDRANVEALRALCQFGIAAGFPDKVDKYADQLLLMSPGDSLPTVAKGQAALARGDQAGALKYAEQVLKTAPQDSSAQILKARVLGARGSYSDAAEFIEATLGAGGDDSSKLIYLKGLYTEARDRPHYQLTLKRLAEAKPNAPAVQIDYADMLYQTGQPDQANALIIKIVHAHPNNVGVAASILDTWLKEGADAITPSQIRNQSASASLQMKAAYAQFASEAGHPELVDGILKAALWGKPISTEHTDAQSALAYAMGLMGQRPAAIGRLSKIIEFDSSQPQALLARARLFMNDKDYGHAIEDARNAVAQDPKNALARITLADALFAHGDESLGENALREGVRVLPADTRLAARLATFLAAKGQRDRASEVLRDLTRASPVSLRALRLRQTLDPASVAEAARQ
ncbi:tetratricopeptide repeat protein [Novosphingobium sp.]|uniref:tetratricopeptide repeat protein n=1 Tax=Novosphingobium sp. TaxID=1874826 RepID=UPI003B527535